MRFWNHQDLGVGGTYAGIVTSFEIGPRERAAINRFNAVMQPVLDRLRMRCGGRPVPEVRDELAKAWGANAGKPLPEPYLSDWAATLSAGERVLLS
jgi:hypothetical protein